jgi:hypothetical protein
VGPRAGLDAEARRKILCLCRESNPGRPIRTPAPSRSIVWINKSGKVNSDLDGFFVNKFDDDLVQYFSPKVEKMKCISS